MKGYEAHASCHTCGLLQTGPTSAMAALNKVAEKHTRLHDHTTTAGLRPVKERNDAAPEHRPDRRQPAG